MELVHLSQLLAATGGVLEGLVPAVPEFGRVCIDSRQVRPGDVFWALRGERCDGHDFVDEAYRKGALAAVVARGRRVGGEGAAVVVEETLAALARFAGWYRQQRETLIIGVTGSVGKTTTRELIYAALNAGFPGIRSQHNYNNEIGLPLTLLDIEYNHDFAVLEMGARRCGEIRALAEIARPEVGVITAIAPAHLETFGSLDGIVRAKGELFEALPPQGIAVLPGDEPWSQALAARAACPVLLVGQQTHNQVRAENVELRTNGLSFEVDGDHYEAPVFGRHYLNSALAAVAIGREIGMTAGLIARGLKEMRGLPGRCRVEQLGSWTVIDDSYNANPVSMQAACELLASWRRGRGKRLLITGDMLELGADAAEYHRQLGARVAASGIERLLVFGPHAGCVVQGARQAGMDPHQLAEFAEMEALLAVLDCWLSEGDVILIKGSRGMRMERILQWLREHAELQFQKHIGPTFDRIVA